MPTKMRKTLWLSLLVLLCSGAFAQPAEVSYSDDFQSYGAPANPPGWVDKSIGGSTAILPPPASGGGTRGGGTNGRVVTFLP